MTQNNILDTAIEFLQGVGPIKADILKKELRIFTFRDLLYHFPFRYIDKTQFHRIADITEESDTVQLKGILRRFEQAGEGRTKRLVGTLRDETGSIDLVWFKQLHFLEQQLTIGKEYIAYGRINNFNGRFSLPHPEMEIATPDTVDKKSTTFDPVYPSTAKLDAKNLDAKGQRKLIKLLFDKIKPADVGENLPQHVLKKFSLPPQYAALKTIHFPENARDLEISRNRLKFEELFYLQLRLLQAKKIRKATVRGHVFEHVGHFLIRFIITFSHFNSPTLKNGSLKKFGKI